MGKVKATELLDTKVEYVSFVEEGANGRQFEIFKSADYGRGNDDPSENISDIIEKEGEKSLFEKFMKFIKGNQNKEENEMADLEKILSAIEGLTKAVSAFVEKFDNLEKKLLKEGDDADAQEPTGDESDAPEGDAPEGDGEDTGNTTEEQPDDDSEENAVVKAVKEMTEKMEKMSERIEKMEKTRNPSNGIQKDDEQQTAENIFAGAF